MLRIRNAIMRRLQRMGIEVKFIPASHRKMVTLEPDGESKGRVLVAYIIEPFLQPKGTPIPNSHTHYWESVEIVTAFLKRGYTVDVISYLNMHFIPHHQYKYFFGARTNFENIVKRLNKDCVKICHMDTAHWITNNTASYNRSLAARERKQLVSVRVIEENLALESADLITVLGNKFTMDSYAYGNVPVHRIRISAPEIYDWPENRDYAKSRNRFLWFGSSRFVHKGLDVVLEVVAKMPEVHLTVCGPIDSDANFKKTYDKELFHCPNIDTVGWVDVSSEKFKNILADSVSVLYPSCSEGGGGSVISCMHGGLLPVVTYESSVDINDFGVLLKDGSPEAVETAIKTVLAFSDDELKARCLKSWQHARENHTKETFSHDMAQFLEHVLKA